MAGISRDERRDSARKFLRMVHLSHFEDHYIHQLSGGMKQRVGSGALAGAAAENPPDGRTICRARAQTRDMLHDELERLWKETAPTIVFVTHSPRGGAPGWTGFF